MISRVSDKYILDKTYRTEWCDSSDFNGCGYVVVKYNIQLEEARTIFKNVKYKFSHKKSYNKNDIITV
jgi:hypothetical protein